MQLSLHIRSTGKILGVSFEAQAATGGIAAPVTRSVAQTVFENTKQTPMNALTVAWIGLPPAGSTLSIKTESTPLDRVDVIETSYQIPALGGAAVTQASSDARSLYPGEVTAIVRSSFQFASPTASIVRAADVARTAP